MRSSSTNVGTSLNIFRTKIHLNYFEASLEEDRIKVHAVTLKNILLSLQITLALHLHYHFQSGNNSFSFITYSGCEMTD